MPRKIDRIGAPNQQRQRGGEVGYRRGETLPHLRSEPNRPPEHRDGDNTFDVSKLVYPVHPDLRERRYLNDPPDNASVHPAGVRAFDAEGPIVGRQASQPSLPEAKIVRVAATGLPAKPFEYEHDRYPPPVFVPPRTRRRRTR